jgi:hypothetical protein
LGLRRCGSRISAAIKAMLADAEDAPSRAPADALASGGGGGSTNLLNGQTRSPGPVLN